MADIYAGLDSDDLVTGEAVTLELPPASFATRLLSGLIDLAIGAALLVGGFTLTSLLASDEALTAVGGILTLVLALVVVPTTLEALTKGKSVGKYAVGTRTVRDDAGPISVQHAFVRSLVGVVEIWVLFGVPALVCSLVNAKGKRVGDLVAGTYVVRDRISLVLPPQVPMPPPLAEWARTADLAPLPDGLAVAVRQLLGRADTLSPDARRDLVHELAGRATRYVAPPPPPGTPPEAFLAAVLAERRTRDSRRLQRDEELRRRLAGR